MGPPLHGSPKYTKYLRLQRDRRRKLRVAGAIKRRAETKRKTKELWDKSVAKAAESQARVLVRAAQQQTESIQTRCNNHMRSENAARKQAPPHIVLVSLLSTLKTAYKN